MFQLLPVCLAGYEKMNLQLDEPIIFYAWRMQRDGWKKL